MDFFLLLGLFPSIDPLPPQKRVVFLARVVIWRYQLLDTSLTFGSCLTLPRKIIETWRTEYFQREVAVQQKHGIHFCQLKHVATLGRKVCLVSYLPVISIVTEKWGTLKPVVAEPTEILWVGRTQWVDGWTGKVPFRATELCSFVGLKRFVIILISLFNCGIFCTWYNSSLRFYDYIYTLRV